MHHVRFAPAVIAVLASALTAYADEKYSSATEKIFTNGIGQKMIWVEPGSFRMGDLTGNGLTPTRNLCER